MRPIDNERLLDLLANVMTKVINLENHVAVLERDNTRLEVECELWRRFFDATVAPMDES